jgi:hypothetical protein
LTLTGFAMHAEGLTQLGTMQTLTRLTLTPRLPEQLVNLFAAGTITDLTLACQIFGKQNVHILATAPTLKVLDLSAGLLSANALIAIAGNPALETLTIQTDAVQMSADNRRLIFANWTSRGRPASSLKDVDEATTRCVLTTHNSARRSTEHRHAAIK